MDQNRPIWFEFRDEIFLQVYFGLASGPNWNYSAILAKPNRNWQMTAMSKTMLPNPRLMVYWIRLWWWSWTSYSKNISTCGMGLHALHASKFLSSMNLLHSKGLRQGGLLTPFLYTIELESFGVPFLKANESKAKFCDSEFVKKIW